MIFQAIIVTSYLRGRDNYTNIFGLGIGQIFFAVDIWDSWEWEWHVEVYF